MQTDGMERVDVDTRFGRFTLEAGPDALSRVRLPRAEHPPPGQPLPGRCTDAVADEVANPLLAAAARQLADYLQGDGRALDVPIDWGTVPEPDRAVLRVLHRRAPYGTTMSYGELAEAAGLPGAAREVGAVMARNPVPVFVPCHRVLAADGSLHGYGGGLALKRSLLELEGALPATLPW